MIICRRYETPAILDSVLVEIEESILTTSVMMSMERVETTGHETQDFHWDNSYSHTWE